jgi:hypothetical protein
MKLKQHLFKQYRLGYVSACLGFKSQAQLSQRFNGRFTFTDQQKQILCTNFGAGDDLFLQTLTGKWRCL